MSGPTKVRPRSSSRLSWLRSQQSPSFEDSFDHGEPSSNDFIRAEDQQQRSFRLRTESPARKSFSSSRNQTTPARSYYQRSFHGSIIHDISDSQSASQDVREDTAELAAWALSDATSIHSGSPASRPFPTNLPRNTTRAEHVIGHSGEQPTFSPHESSVSGLPDPIEEVSEPVSPGSEPSIRRSPGTSILTDLIKNSPLSDQENISGPIDDCEDGACIPTVLVGNGIISQPKETTSLLQKQRMAITGQKYKYDSLPVVERRDFGGNLPSLAMRKATSRAKQHLTSSVRTLANPRAWDYRAIWKHAVSEPIECAPAVVLGLLLNILDALSYGMILFPLGQSIFASLGPDGISMFYVSCIVSQLVYSLGGSTFKGGIGSEMIEVVPFFHKMALTILARVGEERSESVVATTILSYSLSSVLTGLVFFSLGSCKLGALIGFFPRHILIGCIGGVGWFLVATGIEVSARLDGNLEYNLRTLQKLLVFDTIFLWIVPLVLAAILLTVKIWVKHPLTDATYFLSIIAIFYFFVAAIPDLKLEDLRRRGWIFEAPEAGVPFYHFYSLYDFGAVNWQALASTVPAMFALTFFGVLHVPINVPALGLTTGEDNVDVDRELRAHGISNALSGFCGSVQNYLVYTNTVLFMRSGGDSRLAGVLLAFATFGIMVIGPVIIGFIPIMVVGSLIFFLGIDLIREALYDTWGRLHSLEYMTILIIVVTMGAWDFVVGILVGIVLACVSFVLQMSRIPAIRGTLPGGIANSTVRRHPIQHRFLEEAGRQIRVLKLAGYLFFGTIVGVENRIRALLADVAFESEPIRFLVLDLSNVDGVDFSAAEAFTRVNRILNVKNVHMIMCGVDMDSDVGRSLYNVGLFNKHDGLDFFQDLNSALEYCENELLKTLYQHRDAVMASHSEPNYLEVPRRNPKVPTCPSETMFSSPRRLQLQAVASTTLEEQHDTAIHTQRNLYKQPLQLISQTFSSVSEKGDEFWSRVISYFERKEFRAGEILYARGDAPDGFYLLEVGILKAVYRLPQGKFTELIVAGTTCGELPFFSGTHRTSTTSAERDCALWMLDYAAWAALQEEHPDIARELLKITLKLTSERMDAITKYMLLTSG